MTGIERLRELARAWEEHSWSSVGKVRARMMMQVADQIEREHAADRFGMGERAAEDAEAIAWVREHGGLEALRRMFQDADSRRVELCGALGIDLDKGWSEAMAAMCLRLMPEGMEWPRFEGGEPVRPGDRLLDEDGDWFESVSLVFTCDWWSIRGYQTEGFGDLNDDTRRSLEGMAYGTRVKRPAPKVLDADGAEIREKRDVWWICWGDERGIHAERLRVEAICPSGLVGCSLHNGGTWVCLEPSELHVNKPILAAGGRPLSELGRDAS